MWDQQLLFNKDENVAVQVYSHMYMLWTVQLLRGTCLSSGSFFCYTNIQLLTNHNWFLTSVNQSKIFAHLHYDACKKIKCLSPHLYDKHIFFTQMIMYQISILQKTIEKL